MLVLFYSYTIEALLLLTLHFLIHVALLSIFCYIDYIDMIHRRNPMEDHNLSISTSQVSSDSAMLLGAENSRSDGSAGKKKWSSAYEISRQANRSSGDLDRTRRPSPNMTAVYGASVLVVIGIVRL